MSTSATIGTLFESAQDQGDLSAEGAESIEILDVGEQIQEAMGVDVDDIEASEVVLLGIMPDDSGSIRFVQGSTQAVRDGHNLVIQALRDSKQRDNILAFTQLLNGEIINPFGLIDAVSELTTINYDPNQGTPLYDQTAAFLATILAKSQEFKDNGVFARSISLIISDGADQHSYVMTAKKVKAIVDDMLQSENHIIAAMGVDDGSVDFKQVFGEMGVRDEWILTPKSDPSSIRKACQVFSQSAVQASQGSQSFSQVATGGGFTN